ncbi:MAG TPA: dienelactone hydrolase family protein [Ktedonobacterales bacterium]
MGQDGLKRTVRVPAGPVSLEASLGIPAGAYGLVVFAHGSGSGRHSPRNQYVAQMLHQGGLATLLLDLLTPAEAAEDARTRRARFDIGLLAARLVAATDWLGERPATRHFRVGYFGASTGGGAALVAAAERADVVGAVVSRGGRPDLAGAALACVRAPTLLIAGGDDAPVITLNQEALAALTCEKRLVVVPGASHLFEEPGALERVADLALHWLTRYLAPGRTHPTHAGALDDEELASGPWG